MGSVDFGDNTILATDDGNFGSLTGQQAVLGTAGTLQTLSVYVKPGTSAGGNMTLGCYSESGGNPSVKLAQTPSFATVDGWNTVNVQTPVALAAANYWLAYEQDTSGIVVKVTGSGNFSQISFAYNATLPDPFGGTSSSGFHWSLYGTVSTPTAFNNRSNQLRRGILAGNVKMLTFPRGIRPRIRNVKSISRSLIVHALPIAGFRMVKSP